MKAVIFDMDYTLLDRENAITTIAKQQFSPFVSTVSVLQQAVGLFRRRDREGFADRREVYECVERACALNLPVEALVEDFDKRAWSFVRLYDGVGELLLSLRNASIPVGLLTNGSANAQRAKIETVGLDAMVDVVFCAGERDVWKPDPRAFAWTCRELGADPTDTVMVGDTPELDVIPAHELGMTTIWVHSHHPWPDGVPTVFDVQTDRVTDARDTLLTMEPKKEVTQQTV